MCTTAWQLVRAGPRTGTGDVLAAVRSGCGPGVEVCPGDGWAAAAGLAVGCTTPAMPQLASTSTGAAAATAIRACRPRVPMRQLLPRIWAHHRLSAP